MASEVVIHKCFLSVLTLLMMNTSYPAKSETIPERLASRKTTKFKINSRQPNVRLK